MKEDKETRELVRIGSILEKVLHQHRAESDLGLAQVWDLWKQTVGEDIAKNTRPAAFKGKLLLVHVTSSVWVQQLQFLKKDIIGRLNDALGKARVEDIKFKIGPV
jgi:predicted nucleic acid-binding Zn ribbon protein